MVRTNTRTGAKLIWLCVTLQCQLALDKDGDKDKDSDKDKDEDSDGDKDKDDNKDDDKDENDLKESDLVSHHLTSPSALAVISSLHVLLAVHTVSVGYEKMIVMLMVVLIVSAGCANVD